MRAMRHDLLSDALSIIKNAEAVGKRECVVPCSKLVKAILGAMEKAGYIGQFKESKRTIRIQLAGRINAMGVIRPRFPVSLEEFEKFEKRYLPSRDVGLIVVSTSQGVMSHKEAIEKGIGGRLLMYVY